MASVRNVGVVGAGLAGLAAALAVAAGGARVEVFEAAARLPSVDAHIEVVPNLLRELVTLGVAQACVHKGFPYQGTDVVDAHGRFRFRIPSMAAAGPRFPSALGMTYSDLAEVLHAAAVQQGVQFRWGAAVQAIETDADGRGLVRAMGVEASSFDLVLLAGGVGAARLIRSGLHAGTDLPQSWWYALVPRPRSLDRALTVLGPGADKALLVPVGMRTAGLAVMRHEPQAHGGRVNGAAMRAALASHGGMVRMAADHLRDDTPVVVRRVHSSLLDGDWHQGAVLCIGSCAHALPPHFGQSAAQAFEDAVVLGDLVRHVADRPTLFHEFSIRRVQRARLAQAVTTQAAHWDLHPEPATDLKALMSQLDPLLSRPA